tara:strand:- start:3952 stop:4332 length:381 start_codon:yes stop_codon:yes gene_type:complete
MSKRSMNNSDLYIYIGKQILESRYQYRVVGGTRKVMTQTQLGNVCGVTFQQIQKYEKATNKVPIDKLIEIAKATNKNLLYFLPTITNVIERNNNELKRSVQFTEGNKTEPTSATNIGTDKQNDVNN